MNQEIELKAILSEDELVHLTKHFAKIGTLVRDETVYTEKYFSQDKTIDVRLRKTNGKWEIVQKSGHAADAVRDEKTHEHGLSDKDIEKHRAAFRAQKLELAPPWTTERKDYLFVDRGETFEASLQDIPNFARILEIEYKGRSTEHAVIESHIRAIMHVLRVEPVRADEFEAKIKTYKKPQ